MAAVPHYLRLKPQGDRTTVSLVESQSETEIKFRDTTAPNKFTRIFEDISQDELYEEILKTSTEELFEDKDSAFFTLGPSNSGKSFSAYGTDDQPGLAINSLNEIFTIINGNFADYKLFKRHFGECLLITSNSQKNCIGEYGLSISVFEIYNDRIRDLSLDTKKTENQSLDIITDARDGKIKPSKVRQIYVTNLDDAKVVLHKCIKRRAVSATNLNEVSSRSHLFVYFNLHRITGKIVKTTRLTIADLAGSERTKEAKTEGKEFKEGNYTNTSLTELGRCLVLMKSKKFDRSHLRTSKLTRLLLTDLFGNFTSNRIKILLTLDPYSNMSSITHAIRYIQPISKVQISERNSLDLDPLLVQYSEEVKVLRAMNEQLEKDNELAKDKVIEIEMEVRRDVTDVFEQQIQELETLHMQFVIELKEKHEREVDEKLNMLSESYESKQQKLIADFETKRKELMDETMELTQEYESQTNKLIEQYDTKHNMLIRKYEEQLSDLQGQLSAVDVDGLMSCNGELFAKVAELEEKLQKSNEELKCLEKKLEESDKELKVFEKKDKKNSLKIDELTEKLSPQKKRTSDQFEMTESHKKVRFSDVEEDKENIALTLSPIKLPIKVSPNKHFKFQDAIASPKKMVLKESNMDMSLSPMKTICKSPIKSPMRSPTKSPSKSPSKGKKRLNKFTIIQDGEWDVID